jgi:hypothetical protein
MNGRADELDLNVSNPKNNCPVGFKLPPRCDGNESSIVYLILQAKWNQNATPD